MIHRGPHERLHLGCTPGVTWPLSVWVYLLYRCSIQTHSSPAGEEMQTWVKADICPLKGIRTLFLRQIIHTCRARTFFRFCFWSEFTRDSWVMGHKLLPQTDLAHAVLVCVCVYCKPFDMHWQKHTPSLTSHHCTFLTPTREYRLE